MHVPAEVLELYAALPERVSGRAAVEAHLRACADCTSTVDEIHAFERLLRQPQTWGVVSLGDAELSRAEELRRFRMRVTAEDLEAAELLRRYETAPPSPRLLDELPSKAAYRTGGVVRRLCSWANGMCERDPRFALAIAEAAIAIAASLRDEEFPRKAVHQLRGDAWKEQANALRVLGRFDETLEALDAAEAEYQQLPVAGIGLVATKYVRAYVFYEQEQLDAAERLAAEAAAEATHLGDVDRAMRARHLQGELLAARGDVAGASRLFAEVYSHGVAEGDPVWIARESLTLGLCALELNELDAAERHLMRARRGFAELQFRSEITRTDWALARLLFLRGDSDAAVERLEECVAQLARAEMLTDAALAALDAAEMLHAAERTSEVPRLLDGVVATFTRAGKLLGARTALAYLQSAAERGVFEPDAVTHVRRFVAHADRRPELQFVPPPL